MEVHVVRLGDGDRCQRIVMHEISILFGDLDTVDDCSVKTDALVTESHRRLIG